MVAVTASLIAFFAFVIMRVTTPQMTTLFTDLSGDDSSAIIKDLERQAIPFELRNEGAVIMVPKDKVTRLRMKLAESNLPKGGGVGYEIFDKSDALGTTSFVQNINHMRALEGELARTITAHGSALVEEFIAGREFMVLVAEPADPGEPPRTWPPAEVLFEPGETFRHFDAKWTAGSWMEILADAPLAARLRDAVARTFTAIGGVGYARCDLRMSADGQIHLLELNPNCGVFLPPDVSAADEMLAQEPGGRREFLAHILACALRRHAERTPAFTLHHERHRGFGLAAARPIRAGEVIDRVAPIPALDKAAIDIVRKAQPLPPIPDRMHTDRVEGDLPINFGVRSFSGGASQGSCR